PSDGWSYYYYGKALFFSTSYYKAISALNAAIYLGVDQYYPHYYLAYSLYKVSEKNKALSVLEKAMKKYNTNRLIELYNLIKSETNH
ncbi:MAG TPA: hypothetical protein PLN45_04660, partial [Exilispira sp.]|nr:hypothetical protein [Exilispira sp.]